MNNSYDHAIVWVLVVSINVRVVLLQYQVQTREFLFEFGLNDTKTLSWAIQWVCKKAVFVKTSWLRYMVNIKNS